MNAEQLLANYRVVPVVVVESATAAVPLAISLAEAGMDVIEVTLRSAAALDAITAIAKEVPKITLGAGSLRTAQQVHDAVNAGAKFGVSPGATDSLLSAAEGLRLPFVPGAITPSESLILLERGYTLQKLFPASIVGGVDYLKALGAPLPEVKFMPTGGVSPDNMADYLALANVAAVGGSWIAPANLLKDGDYREITTRAHAALTLARR